MKSSTFFLLFYLSLASLNGCSSNYPKTYPVNGTVQIDGKPLPNAIVTLVPDKGNSANGTTDASGNFSLSTFTEGDGALPGEYRVSVMPKDPPPMPGEEFMSPGAVKPGKYVAPIPTKYADPNTSGLVVTVKASVNAPKIELASRGK